MAFNPPPKKHVEFADLLTILAQSKNKLDSATYQTVREIILRLGAVQDDLAATITDAGGIPGPPGPSGPSGPPGPTGPPGTIGLHAPTHSAGATDPVDVKNLAGYPGGTTAFLRADHTFAIPPGGSGGGGMNLDYLGTYVPGQVYNDGDFVIGPDGVLYECVVDGTNSAPIPWPGTGIAVNVSLDATYWVVSPHPQLVNARALNALGTGYVRSTVGEPSVVPTIPLTDTTGILPDNRLTSNVALKNIDNLFTVPQTLPAASAIKGAFSILYFNDIGSPVNTKIWRLLNDGSGSFYIQGLTDDFATATTNFSFARNGTLTASAFAGGGAALTNLNASALASGTVPLARLGTNAPAADLVLYGDNTWKSASSIPSGLIMISYRPCPVGWTRVTSWDGLFLRSGPNIGVSGGSNTHGHSFSGSVPAHGHTGTTNALGDHNHSFSGSLAGSTDQNREGNMNVDAGSSGAMSRGPHTHDFTANYSGVTANAGFHSHALNVDAAGGMAVTGNIGIADNLPPFVDIYYCEKN